MKKKIILAVTILLLIIVILYIIPKRVNKTFLLTYTEDNTEQVELIIKGYWYYNLFDYNIFDGSIFLGDKKYSTINHNIVTSEEPFLFKMKQKLQGYNSYITSFYTFASDVITDDYAVLLYETTSFHDLNVILRSKNVAITYKVAP